MSTEHDREKLMSAAAQVFSNSSRGLNKPYREERIAERINADVDVELSDREVIAESNMPSERELIKSFANDY